MRGARTDNNEHIKYFAVYFAICPEFMYIVLFVLMIPFAVNVVVFIFQKEKT